jgi:uncharacterized membrane protein YdjX (TVP38/TMEM64 family)
VALAMAALLGVSLVLWRQGWSAGLLDRTALQRAIDRLGPWGPLGIVLGQMAQVLLAPIPGQIVGWMAGYLYGPWDGAALSMAGLMGGTALAIWLARQLGRPLVERWASRDLIARIDAYVARRGALVFFMIFLIPFLPDDACCFAAGLTRLPMRKLLLAALLGRFPGVLVATYLGARSQQLGGASIALLAGLSAVLAVGIARIYPALERRMFAWLDRWGRQRRS